MTKHLIQELSFEDFINNYESIDSVKSSEKLKREVTKILDEVKNSKDNALINLSKKFDDVEFSSVQNFKYEKNDFKNAYERLDSKIINNLEYLKSRIIKFHSKKTVTGWKSEDSAFNEYGQIVRPINRVGLYAPGGTATYPSSILMTSVLAEIAGVNEIILAFPPSDEKVTNLMLACCYIGGVTEAISIGGAQSIAAMGFAQFMPDNYRRLAVDFDGDGKKDILSNPADAIGSVANFLSSTKGNKHGWERSGFIAVEADPKKRNKSIKSSFKLRSYKDLDIKAKENLDFNDKYIQISLFPNDDSKDEFWLGDKNLYAITRYNPSSKYAMTVFLLSEQIAKIGN